jgi:hypothetical protein
MAGFGFHNAHIALGEAAKTGIAIALIESFFNGRVAMNTGNTPCKTQTNFLTHQSI